MPAVASQAGAQLLAALGAGAIIVASVVALRQKRLKLLIAYSTLAQIGYLFLMFALAFGPASARIAHGGALTGGILQAISHANAKAAMFMSAGMIYATLGHDRITGLGGAARMAPISVLAFALGGLALVGVPPSGAYLAKQLLLQAADETQQWWWAIVIQAGGIFTSGYLVLVLVHALAPADEPARAPVRAPRAGEATALILALLSLLLGLVHWEAFLPVPAGVASISISLGTLAKALWPIAAGGVLATLLGRWGERQTRILFADSLGRMAAPARAAVLALGRTIEGVDSALRQWPAACLSLLGLAVLLGALLFRGW
jgi:NADH:ubiquinone oxidoreductase subunit 5 (subunit L)/multisubunit Na+/H+ antiporter MnhA subunit